MEPPSAGVHIFAFVQPLKFASLCVKYPALQADQFQCKSWAELLRFATIVICMHGNAAYGSLLWLNSVAAHLQTWLHNHLCRRLLALLPCSGAYMYFELCLLRFLKSITMMAKKDEVSLVVKRDHPPSSEVRVLTE